MALTKVSYGLITGDASSADLNIDANTMFVDASTNKVGIGTNSPAQALVVVGAVKISDGILNAGAAGSASVFNEDGTTADFRVESTSNTHMLFINGGTDKLGINTASPVGTFHAAGTSHTFDTPDGSGVTIIRTGNSAHLHLFPAYSSVPTIMGQGTGGLHLGYDSSTAGIRINTSNNVGIGTTSPSSKLTVEGDIKQTTGDLLYSGGGNWDIKHTVNDQNIVFSTSQSGSTSEKVRIKASGFVGIGTASPLDLLHIKSSSTDARLVMDGHTGADAEVKFAEGGTVKYTIGHDAASDNFVIGTTNVDTSQRLVIDSSGNVGINCTNPQVKFVVQTTDGGSGIEYSLGASLNYLQSYDRNASDYVALKLDGEDLRFGTNNGTERMRIDSAGTLVLKRGTIDGFLNPTGAALEFDVNRNPETGVFDSTSRSHARMIISGANGGSHIQFNTANANNTVATERMRIASDGNVGIGENSPSAPLHVNHGTTHVIFTGPTGNGGGGLILRSSNASTADDQEYGMLNYQNNSGTALAQIVGKSEGTGNDKGHLEFNTKSGSGSMSLRMRIRDNGAVQVTGALSKGSGSFEIPHPLYSKKATHLLRHSFIEGPQCDNIYRGTVELVDGVAQVNLDTVSNMTSGTFLALNTDVQVFTTNETDWDNVKGTIVGNILTITCQNINSTAKVSWLVIGERQDDNIKSSTITDNDGKLITEPEVYEGGT